MASTNKSNNSCNGPPWCHGDFRRMIRSVVDSRSVWPLDASTLSGIFYWRCFLTHFLSALFRRITPQFVKRKRMELVDNIQCCVLELATLLLDIQSSKATTSSSSPCMCDATVALTHKCARAISLQACNGHFLEFAFHTGIANVGRHLVFGD